MTRQEIIELSLNEKSQTDHEKLKSFFADLNNVQSQRQTIVFYTSGETGTSFYRIFMPMLAIYRATDEFNLVYTENLSPVYLNLANLIVIHRASDQADLAHSIYKMWPSDKPRPYLIHNVDDNESLLPKTHPLYAVWKIHKRDQQSIRSLRECDAVEITTNKLRNYCLAHNKNTFITRNYFNWKMPQWNLSKKRPIQEFITNATSEQISHFEFPSEWNDKIVVGWAGLTSHFEDIKKMAIILKDIYDKYPNTVFCLAGMALKDSQINIEQGPDGKTITREVEIPEDQKYRNRVKKLFEDFAPERIRIYDALQLSEYGWFNSLFDIGLAYVEHNVFNSCKSEIKVVEYMKYGVIPIFSDFAGYSDLIQIMENDGGFSSQETTKLSCRTEYNLEEWSNKISYWIENFNSDERKNLSKRMSEFVSSFYDIDRTTPERISKYKKFIEDQIEREESSIQQITYEFA